MSTSNEVDQLRTELERIRRSYHVVVWLSWWIAASGITAALAGPWSWPAAVALFVLPYPLYVWIGRRLD